MHNTVFKRFWKVWEWGIGRTVAATIAAHTNSISVGMCQGYSAVLIPQLEAVTSSIPVTPDGASWIASLGVISTPGGAILAGLLTELLGRKTTVQLTSVPFLIGWAIIAFAPDFLSLCVGRFISGLAIGMASACYVYVAEITQPDHRGFLSAFGPVFVSLGVLIVYSLGYVMTWQSVSAVCAAAAVFSFSVMHLVPETPSWLASRDRITEANDALVWLRRTPAVAAAELAEVLQTLKASHDAQDKKNLKYYVHQCVKPCVWKPFLILLVFFLFQEGSGMYVVLYYAVNVFQQVGSSVNYYVASIIVGVVRLIMSILGALCIQHFNRKTLAMASGLGMAVSMGVVGTYEYLYENLPIEVRPLSWIPLACILLNVCASMLGMLQLPWLMVGELFPLSVRGIMGGVVSSLAYMFIFGIVKVYPDVQSALQMHGTMWVFTAASLGVILYVKLFLPETRGKSLLEIEMQFMGNSCDDNKRLGRIEAADSNNTNNNNNNDDDSTAGKPVYTISCTEMDAKSSSSS